MVRWGIWENAHLTRLAELTLGRATLSPQWAERVDFSHLFHSAGDHPVKGEEEGSVWGLLPSPSQPWPVAQGRKDA